MVEKFALLEEKVDALIEKIDKFLLSKDKLIAAGCLALLCIALIPLYMFGRYTVPLADDYSMVLGTHAAWEQTHSIWQVFLAAVGTSVEYYMTWSGAFVGMFFQSLLPGLGDFSTYFIASWILITLFVASNFYLGKVVFCEMFGTKKSVWIIFSSIVVLYQVEHMPYVYDAFYWYIGAMAYIFPYTMKLIYTGVLLHCTYSWSTEKKVAPVKYVLFGLYTVFIAAIDYGCTSTPMVIVLVLVLAYSITQNKGRVYAGIAMVGYLVTWIFCVSAPGNSARQALVGARNGVIYSIKEALYAGAHYMSVWTGSRMVLLSLALLPLIVYAVKKTNIKFKYPAICVLMTYGIFSSLFAPRVYANYGAVKDVVGYTLNYVHCLYVTMWVVNLVYLTGWVVNTVLGSKENEKERKIKFSPVIYYFSILVAVVMLFKSGVYVKGEYTSVQATYYIITGSAENYMNAMLEREELMKSSQGEDIVVYEIPMVFATSGGGDISAAPETWTNVAVSKYYHLNSIQKQAGN